MQKATCIAEEWADALKIVIIVYIELQVIHCILREGSIDEYECEV